MAKKSSGRRKTQTKADKVEAPDLPKEDIIEDAEVVAEETADNVFEDAAETLEETPEPVEAIEEEVAPAEEENHSETEAYEPTPTPEPAQKQTSSFIPLVLGGLFAGIIGYGIATLQGGDNTVVLEETIAAQSDEISALRDEFTAFAAAPQDDGISDQVAVVEQSIADLTARIDADFAALDERMTTVEKQPSADGTLQEAAIAAYERDIAELRDQISEQQEEMRSLLTQTREEAQSIESSAIASARKATARAALAIVQGALETGAPMGAALIDLEGATEAAVPDALMSASDGVTTLAALQADFPDLARGALATARQEGASGEDTSGLSGFFRNQFDVRSVEPQEGDSADAVLSRAEAAVREGRLNDSLAELASLPEVARAELTDWIGRAEQRAAALDAAATLASELNVN